MTSGSCAPTVLPMDTLQAHINPATLAHIIERQTHDTGVTKSDLARAAEMTPANLREYETGVRNGATQKVRDRIADAVGVPPEVFTCWCPRPEGRCVNAPPFAVERAVA